eukprot:CAMPEP_0174924432 /NCGR_PEP_ID=MMETSP1355-20121228/7239_1 /TAXON_ID=464990 /ORGANISM="Hemiselmis tepida, Strain CCMP443" /LENGTH=386 /DNA_ID=CAMNT_0016170237 /DNA_START=134 /DNA_END=1294 /DNA_ORIENTATION=+
MAPSGGIGLQLVTSWNAGEHRLFVDAMEASSRVQPEMTPTQIWKYLSDAVPSKTLQDVKRHALLYLHKLNMESEERMRTSSSADTVVASDEAAQDIADEPQRKPVQPKPVKRSGSCTSLGSIGRKRKSQALHKSDEWSPAEEMHFEKLLLDVDPVDNDRWDQIASRMGNKTSEQVRHHYRHIREQIKQQGKGGGGSKKAKGSKAESSKAVKGKGKIQTHGQSWSEEEHRRFLEGLERFGKGDWRSIARQSVMTRNPTQVASHAQKFFLRQQMGQTKVPDPQGKQSIHDITTDAVRGIIENEQGTAAQHSAAAQRSRDVNRKEVPAAQVLAEAPGSASKRRRRSSALATVSEGDWEGGDEGAVGVGLAPLGGAVEGAVCMGGPRTYR